MSVEPGVSRSDAKNNIRPSNDIASRPPSFIGLFTAVRFTTL
jgi:hypothetical protein